MKNIGVIGVGSIGRGIAYNIEKHGYNLTVYDTSIDRMKYFEGKAYLADGPADVIRHCECVLLSLPKSEIVEHTIEDFISEGIKGKLIIDTSTSYPMSTRKLYHEIKSHGGALIDAPLMAGPDEAQAGTLDIVVGGDDEDYERAKEVFQTYCRSFPHVGAIGNGHMLKIAMNFCSLTEALLFAQLFPVMDKAGISPEMLFDTFENSVLRNWTSTFYTKKYVAREYRLDFALELGVKDLSYLKRLYEEFNVPGFILDGALDLCRVALGDQKPDEQPIDMSYPCETMYRLLGM